MAFTSTKSPAGLICIGFGTPTVDTTGSTTAASPTVVTLTSFAGSGVCRMGWLKVRVVGLTSLVPTVITVTGTDGTTTVTLYWSNLTSATSGQGIELIIPFLSELNLTTITLSVTHTGGTSPQVDAEVVGNP